MGKQIIITMILIITIALVKRRRTKEKQQMVIMTITVASEPQRVSRLFFTIARKTQNLADVRSETVNPVFYIRGACDDIT